MRYPNKSQWRVVWDKVVLLTLLTVLDTRDGFGLRSRFKQPRLATGRVLWVALGITIAVANAQGGEFLGFSRPVDADAIGVDLSKTAIAVLALWLVYLGARPAKAGPISH